MWRRRSSLLSLYRYTAPSFRRSYSLLSATNRSAVYQAENNAPARDNSIYNRKSTSDDSGYILSVSDGIAKATGLRNVKFGELVVFPEYNLKGMACNLNKKSVDILILGDDRHVRAGTVVMGTSNSIKIPVGKKLLGRVVDALGDFMDAKKSETFTISADINVKAPGIIYREKVSEPVFTGLKIIDSLIPVGKGQRELIIGDKGTGKTSIAIDTILNQKYENLRSNENQSYCVYVSIGQKRSSVKAIYDNLVKLGAADHTVIVSASASDSASMQYLAPYSGCAIAEYFMSFAHSIIIYDDLTQHAAAYRQISLLLRRPPGREAYPGDVFYLHSRLLERSCKLNRTLGGGSMTAFPIIETLFGDVTAYIPTNVISITDGQIFLDRNLFTEGILPAVNVGLSVSRVGSAAQILAMRKIAGSLKLELAQYREVKDFMKFGSDLNEETLNLIKKGRLLTELLKQSRFAPVSPEHQVLILYAGMNGYLDNVPLNELDKFFAALLEYVEADILFKPYLNLIRNDKFFNQFGFEFLTLLMEQFRSNWESGST